jgi:hypothetical protein
MVNVGISGDAALSEWRKQSAVVAGLTLLFAVVWALFVWTIARMARKTGDMSPTRNL